MYFITEYESGKTPRQILENARLDIDIVGVARVRPSRSRLRKLYNDKGALSLENTRVLNSSSTLII